MITMIMIIFVTFSNLITLGSYLFLTQAAQYVSTCTSKCWSIYASIYSYHALHGMQVIKDHVSATQDNSRQLELQCSIADVPTSLGRAKTIFIHPLIYTIFIHPNDRQSQTTFLVLHIWVVKLLWDLIQPYCQPINYYLI